MWQNTILCGALAISGLVTVRPEPSGLLLSKRLESDAAQKARVAARSARGKSVEPHAHDGGGLRDEAEIVGFGGDNEAAGGAEFNATAGEPRDGPDNLNTVGTRGRRHRRGDEEFLRHDSIGR
jgi:hypothetical protein